MQKMPEDHQNTMEKRANSRKKSDQWELPELTNDGPNWHEYSNAAKAKRILLNIGKTILLLGLLYFFVCSISILASAFRLLGGKDAGKIFQNSAILANPIAGLMIGILATILVQSSSTSTSIVVTMVSAKLLRVSQAVYIVMGANIGTSVTNTLVALFHSADRAEFRRAFAAATVHDMFNWLCVISLLPVEFITSQFIPNPTAVEDGYNTTGILVYLSKVSTGGIRRDTNQTTKGPDFLKALTKPLTQRIVQLDKKVIKQIAQQAPGIENKTIAKHPGSYLFDGVSSDSLMGTILLISSLLVLCVCLIFIVKILRSMLQGSIAILIRKTVNADLPGPAHHLTGYLAIVMGAILTFLVQSSSIFTSTLTPLVAVGVLTLERTYPLTLGANIGTTGTALIAAFASDGLLVLSSAAKCVVACMDPMLQWRERVRNFSSGWTKVDHLVGAGATARFSDVERIHPLEIALCHLYFNVIGILVWFPIPVFRNVPIDLAKFLGDTTAEYRWFAALYIIFMFLIVPGLTFALSLGGPIVLAVVGIPILLTFSIILLVNCLQKRNPALLPGPCRTWEWCPRPLHSLDPYDEVIAVGLSRLRQSLPCSCDGRHNQKVEDSATKRYSRNNSQSRERKLSSSAAGELPYKPTNNADGINSTRF